ncbi:MAG TPA: DeoR/GlpR family DNA-binding transcription regulator [Phnomibacter sp.]|nr:DeoR/GlpR family DNA-binding transcription regulator [Phnomibacter sp.]
MLKKERQAYIIQHLNIHNKLLSTDLCQKLNVSEDTVRRDLQELADEGRLIKVHGGALSNAFHFTLKNGQVYNASEKRTIAEKSAALIQNRMVVLLSGGTTIRELVKALPPVLQATFITPSIPIALELMEHPRCEVLFVGNKLNKEAQLAVGAEVTSKLSTLKADLCFLGTNAIDVQAGITDASWEIIEVKKAMIGAADKVVSTVISEKLATVQPMQVCSIQQVDILVTELEAQDERLKPYQDAGVQVL